MYEAVIASIQKDPALVFMGAVAFGTLSLQLAGVRERIVKLEQWVIDSVGIRNKRKVKK